MIRLKKGLSSRYWEEILIAIIGEQFDVGNEICGAVVSVRAAEDILSVWNRNSENTEAKNKIRDMMRKILRLPSYVAIEYKVHRDSLTDGTSFRNTSVWRPTNQPRPNWTGATDGSNTREGGRSHGTSAEGGSSGGQRYRQPPGGVTGDGTTWSQQSSSHRERPSWKSNNFSVNTSAETAHNSGNPLISPIVSSIGESPSTAAPAWSSSRSTPKESGGETTERSSGGGWGRDRASERERGNIYKDDEGANVGDGSAGHRSQTRSHFPRDGSAPSSSTPTGAGPGAFPPRRRFDTATTEAEAAAKKKTGPTTNFSEQVSVWGRGARIVETPKDKPDESTSSTS